MLTSSPYSEVESIPSSDKNKCIQYPSEDRNHEHQIIDIISDKK